MIGAETVKVTQKKGTAFASGALAAIRTDDEAVTVPDGKIALGGADKKLVAVSVTSAGSPVAKLRADISELPEGVGSGKVPTVVGTFPEFTGTVLTVDGPQLATSRPNKITATADPLRIRLTRGNTFGGSST